MNKKWLLITGSIATLLLLASLGHAGDNSTPQVVQLASPYPSLNRIHYVVQEEEWVVNDSARVIVSVNANLTDVAFNHFQDKMNQSLASLAKDTTWHITQFNRNQDSSGLEQVSAQAEARIANNLLADLRAKADKLSAPGIKYQIMDIQYGPSDEDVQKAKDDLRQKVYANISEELNHLNKLYHQDFFVNNIDFAPIQSSPPPMPMNYARMTTADSGNNNALSVNQKLILQADVVLAAKVK